MIDIYKNFIFPIKGIQKNQFLSFLTKSLEKAKGLSKEDAMVLFQREGMQRTNLLFCVLAVNAMAYCMIGYEGALYCGLVALGAMIYSYPTKRVLEQYLSDKEK